MSKIEGKLVSNSLKVSNDERLIEAAMNEAEAFVGKLDLDSKKALHIRLLTEEILEMVKSMVKGYIADFWIEAENDECRICLEAKADINIEKEKMLMSASSDGKNTLVKGFTAKIAQFINHHKEYINDMMNAGDEGFYYLPTDYLCVRQASSFFAPTDITWSMMEYRNYLYDSAAPAEEVEEARDELEKSIVANIADDVKVGVMGDKISLVAIKKI